ncbi:hypothetical protein HHK36_006733 [Tetracentron sinense]|uniref:Uncharacterized protein n=1 Tax=Tetracentron sinense TaxID=13715 RepID=A0A835DPD6_TETSI|nr:hypothetical protein HHK36_006733 [Tetracentron sinense]
MLAYGVAADAVNNYVRIDESTSIETLKRFVRAVVEVFGEEYLRSPNNEDISRLLAQGEDCGLLGMLGSINCMHWKWKNCTVAWKGQYERGGHYYPSTILEAVALNIMKACIVMYNMIDEDEHDVYIPDLNYDAIEEHITVSHEHSPIKLTEDDVPNTDFVQRPLDKNAKKRKMCDREKNIIETPIVVDLLKEMMEARKKTDAAYLEAIEEKRHANAKKLELTEMQLNLKADKQ